MLPYLAAMPLAFVYWLWPIWYVHVCMCVCGVGVAVGVPVVSFSQQSLFLNMHTNWTQNC